MLDPTERPESTPRRGATDGPLGAAPREKPRGDSSGVMVAMPAPRLKLLPRPSLPLGDEEKNDLREKPTLSPELRGTRPIDAALLPPSNPRMDPPPAAGGRGVVTDGARTAPPLPGRVKFIAGPDERGVLRTGARVTAGACRLGMPRPTERGALRNAGADMREPPLLRGAARTLDDDMPLPGARPTEDERIPLPRPPPPPRPPRWANASLTAGPSSRATMAPRMKRLEVMKDMPHLAVSPARVWFNREG